jgi:hypothetical protein
MARSSCRNKKWIRCRTGDQLIVSSSSGNEIVVQPLTYTYIGGKLQISSSLSRPTICLSVRPMDRTSSGENAVSLVSGESWQDAAPSEERGLLV